MNWQESLRERDNRGNSARARDQEAVRVTGSAREKGGNERKDRKIKREREEGGWQQQRGDAMRGKEKENPIKSETDRVKTWTRTRERE